MRNAFNKRKPREYAQKIIQSLKNADMTILQTQLNIMYNDIDSELQRDIKKSKTDADVILNIFLTNLNDRKHE